MYLVLYLIVFNFLYLSLTKNESHGWQFIHSVAPEFVVPLETNSSDSFFCFLLVNVDFQAFGDSSTQLKLICIYMSV